jgi:hypothetical protein
VKHEARISLERRDPETSEEQAERELRQARSEVVALRQRVQNLEGVVRCVAKTLRPYVDPKR